MHVVLILKLMTAQPSVEAQDDFFARSACCAEELLIIPVNWKYRGV